MIRIEEEIITEDLTRETMCRSLLEDKYEGVTPNEVKVTLYEMDEILGEVKTAIIFHRDHIKKMLNCLES